MTYLLQYVLRVFVKIKLIYQTWSSYAVRKINVKILTKAIVFFSTVNSNKRRH